MAIAYVSAKCASAGGDDLTLTAFPLDVAAGNNRIVVIGVMTAANDADGVVSSVTFDGTEVVDNQLFETLYSGSGDELRFSMYYILDADLPATTGTPNIYVNSTGTKNNGVTIAAALFTGALQETPTNWEFVGTTNDATVYDTITPAKASSIIFEVIAGDDNNITVAPEYGTLRAQELGSTQGVVCGTLDATSTGVHNVGWNVTADPNDNYGIMSLEILAYPTFTPTMMMF